jgi:serine/threonine protein kinase
VAKLYVERGPLRGKELYLEEGKVYTIGRDPACALTFPDSLTSRKHVAVRVHNGAVHLRDLNSKNGTFVNGQEASKPVSLKLGDQVEIGETLVSVLADDERATTGGLIGREIAGYRILERVGRGGMGTVYRAEQRSLGRIVAFKVLSPSLVWDKEFIDRFMHEVRAAARLVHPNIVRALDCGQEEQIYYFVMEFMSGGSLEEKIDREGRIAPDRAVHMLMDVCRGLQYAESQGIIHRDIKPDNLMLDDKGVVKIVDMGIAGYLEGKKKLSQRDGVFGSPHYMAPEQAAGEHIDHRADIYGLGATAYAILSGRTLFRGESQLEIMSKHVNDEPEDLARVAPWVPKRLCQLTMKMLAKNPEDRFKNATDALEALQRLGGQDSRTPRPSELRRVPTSQRNATTNRYARQRRSRLIVAGVLIVLVALVVVLLLIPS